MKPNVDKFKEMGLTPIESDVVKVPGIRELPLTLECKVVYRALQSQESFMDEALMKSYPQDVPSDFSGSNRDYHFVYCGEIVNAYLIEE